jgi:hypothetical protein
MTDTDDVPPLTDAADGEVVLAKLLDAEVPGFGAELDPPEAELAGAFVEDALTEADAFESTPELVDAV